jgi:hypothetical protein
VQVTESGKASLEVNSASDGKIQSYVSPLGYLYTDPKFISDTTIVTGCSLTSRGAMALVRLSLLSGQEENVAPPFFHFRWDFFIQKRVPSFFTAGFSGNDQLYNYRLSDSTIWQVTAGGIGKYNVHAANGKLYWSEPTAEGSQIRVVNREPAGWKKISIDTILSAAPYAVAGVTRQGTSFLSQFGEPDMQGKTQLLPGAIERRPVLSIFTAGDPIIKIRCFVLPYMEKNAPPIPCKHSSPTSITKTREVMP